MKQHKTNDMNERLRNGDPEATAIIEQWKRILENGLKDGTVDASLYAIFLDKVKNFTVFSANESSPSLGGTCDHGDIRELEAGDQ